MPYPLNLVLTGRPLMIGGIEEISEMNLFFPGNPFRIKNFSSAKPLKIYFFLESASQNLFFPGESLSKFIFSWRRASEIIFFSISSCPTPRSLMVVPLDQPYYGNTQIYGEVSCRYRCLKYYIVTYCHTIESVYRKN